MRQTYGVAAFLLACILLMIHFKFGLEIFNVFEGNWGLVPCSDSVPGILSWEYFREQAWMYPLGQVQGYNYPMTSNIGLTDGIPIMAILFKLLHPLFGGEAYYYYGIWFGLSFLLQAFFAYKLLSIFLPKRYWLIAFATLFFLFSPPFLHRFGHHALTVHWTILASFWLYFHPSMSTTKKLFAQIGLTVLMTWTHPYPAVMMLGMTGALLLQEGWVKRQLKWWQTPAIFLGTIAVLIGLWEVMGYFSLGENSLKNTDFGFYSANLNALFNSMDKTVLLPALPLAKEGQYEGFAFLGTGVLGILGIVLLIRFGAKKRMIFPKYKATYWPLLLVVLLATLFSLSHVWTIGEITFAKMDYPSILAHRFRSSGRFIWFLHYLTLLSILVVFLKSRLNSYFKWVILLFALGIQIYDNSPFFERKYINHNGNNYSYKKDLWHPIIEHADRIWTYPPHGEAYRQDCDFGKLVNIAKTFQKPISTGRSAYYNMTEMSESRAYLHEQLANNIEEERDAVFITTFDHYEQFQPLIEQNIVQAFVLEQYLVFMPTDLYRKHKNLKNLSPITNELKNCPPIFIKDFLEKRSDATIILAVKDDAKTALSGEFKDWMKAKGSNIRELPFRGGYAAILRKNLLATENIATTDTAQVSLGKIQVQSAGRAGGNFSSIRVNGKEYSPNLRGINIVVLKKDTIREVINFDTYRSSYLNRAYKKY